MKNRFKSGLILLSIVGLILELSPPISASQYENTTTMTHNPVDSINSGRRLFLSVTVSDPNKIDVVRVYFKAQDGLDYNFIALRNDVRSKYTGLLPAAAPECTSFDYLILVKNGINKIVISDTYTVSVVNSNITVPPAPNKVHVYTELTDAPEKMPGFFDNFSMGVVPSSLRYGTVAGLYSTENTHSASTFSGKVTVPSTTGISSTTLAVGGATAVSIAVGGFAINYGSSGGGTGVYPYAGKSCPYTGKWSGTWQETRCADIRTSGPWGGTVDESCYFTSNKGDIGGSIDPTTGEAPELHGTQIIICDNIEIRAPYTASQAIFRQSSVNGSYTAELVSGTFTGSKR